ncbi:LuxR family transcriptional regulator [uncultured Tateyamaria sp.]|uniref:helix-turn-helix transcriptional regulator n=1 Tax=uncultured Tateyamaria sp. TaxID=455651 RepID=UPI002636A879|nr:LuxR family transcriptional regulator [uncultured Tateyamaria sp.]
MTHTVLEAIQAETSTPDLWSLLLRYFHDRGVTKVSYHHFTGDVQSQRSVNVSAAGFSQEWVCHYIEQKLFTVDPITEFARSTIAPFRWSHIRDLVRLSREQILYLNQMRDAGVGDGLAFQVFGPGLRNGYVGLGVDNPADFPSDSAVLDFQVVAQAAHIRYCALNPAALAVGDLSPRERQILRWIARGKSNSSIADILLVSPHTVDTLVRRIFSKLGVADRTTAAIQGVGAGLILP